jgi:hypothetical protein
MATARLVPMPASWLDGPALVDEGVRDVLVPGGRCGRPSSLVVWSESPPTHLPLEPSPLLACDLAPDRVVAHMHPFGDVAGMRLG